MIIHLQLDAQYKKTLEDLFHISTRLPSLGLGGGILAEDSGCVFRAAKEFSFNKELEESRPVAIHDLAGLLRFICWLLAYYGSHPSADTERARRLKALFACIVLQGQAQFSGFQDLLSLYGIDRQIEDQVNRPPHNNSSHTRHRSARGRATDAAKEASLDLTRTDRTKQVHIRVGPLGAELLSTTTESTWTAIGRKQDS